MDKRWGRQSARVLAVDTTEQLDLKALADNERSLMQPTVIPELVARPFEVAHDVLQAAALDDISGATPDDADVTVRHVPRRLGVAPAPTADRYPDRHRLRRGDGAAGRQPARYFFQTAMCSPSMIASFDQRNPVACGAGTTTSKRRTHVCQRVSP